MPAPIAARQVRLTPAIKGLDFVRVAKAMAVTKNWEAATAFAMHEFGENSAPALHLKASVGGLDSLTSGGGEELARWNQTTAEFFSVVRPLTIIGRMQGLRQVPLNIRLVTEATGVTAYWTGEGQAVPVSVATFAEDTLEPLKIVALTVATEDLLRSSDPAAELILRDSLVATLVEAIDRTFIDPTNAGNANIKPSAVTHGLPTIASTGDADEDIACLLAAFSGDLSQAYFVGSPLTFATMNSFARPGIGARGGEISGIPAIASESAAANLALIDASAIALGEGPADIQVSREATIEMSDAPSGSSVTPTATSQVSLWQTNSVAILVNRIIAWERVRPGDALVSGVQYVAGVS
jgi:hypothetical protein